MVGDVEVKKVYQNKEIGSKILPYHILNMQNTRQMISLETQYIAEVGKVRFWWNFQAHH